MDRNTTVLAVLLMYSVALRKESVDRNMLSSSFHAAVGSSLSARRAWIEICYLDNIEITEASRSPQGERG